MKRLVLLMTLGALAWGEARIVYTKKFPGSTPAFVHVTVQNDGKATYRESADEDDNETFQMEPDAVAAIFQLADNLNHFKTPIESGLKVANMGEKTYRWEDGADTAEVKYNYSTDESARLLQDWFERIVESETLFFQLRRAIRYDKLGVNDATLRLQVSWERKRLVGLQQLLPLLERVAGNEQFLHMARERSGNLVEAFRVALKVPAQ